MRSKMDTRRRFIDKIAAEYFRRYRDISAAEAKAYAMRISRANPGIEKELHHAINVVVRKNLRGK